MKKLSKVEMKNVKGGNKPVPPGCLCIGIEDPQPIGCGATGMGYPTYCNTQKPVLICCNN